MCVKKYYDLDTIKNVIWDSDVIDWEYGDVDPESIIHALEDYTPSADVQPIIHGKWLEGEWCGEDVYICSECGYGEINHPKTNYCPNCGADMNEEQI